MNNQYNQFNSQYDDLYQNQYNNLGMDQQYDRFQQVPYINKNDNRGGGFFSFLLAVLVLAGLVAFLLDYTGVVDVKSYVIKYTDKFFGDKNEKEDEEKPEEKQEEKEEKKEENPVVEENENIPSDVKDNLTKLCSNLDENNNYVLDDNNKCENDICEMIVSTEDSYYKICSTGEIGRKESQAEKEEKQVHLFLDTACSLVDSNGIYNGGAITIDNNSISCENYVCRITYKEKEYSKTCE